ncbi:MAG: hypothetical protein ACYTBJ_19825 [Planctomycetota bacterium]
MIHSIEQIERMRKAITPGNWRYYEMQNGWAEWGQPDPPPVYVVEGPDYALDSIHEGAIDHEPDADFIGDAPEIVDWLLARVNALELALVEIRDHKGFEASADATDYDRHYASGANDGLKQAQKIARAALGGDA